MTKAKTHPLVKVLGPPDPVLAMGIRFEGGLQLVWDLALKGVEAGYFMDGFLRLFDDRLEALEACLEAWSFLVPAREDRIILGYNAYGTILVLEQANSGHGRVHVLDPFRLVYWTDPYFDLYGVLSRWLPDGLVPHFLDDSLYRARTATTRLPDGFILAAKEPEPLGGKLESDNFQLEEIVSYYQTTGPLYRKSGVKAASRRPRKKR